MPSRTFHRSREFSHKPLWKGEKIIHSNRSNSSDPLSSQVLADDDVVKVHIGAHIDGFAAISAETLVVGASDSNPVTGRRADVLQAAWHAAQVAMRLVKVGNKNWAITDAVAKVSAAWDCKPVEGESATTCLYLIAD